MVEFMSKDIYERRSKEVNMFHIEEDEEAEE